MAELVQEGWGRPTLPPYATGRPCYEVKPLWALTDEAAVESPHPEQHWVPLYRVVDDDV